MGDDFSQYCLVDHLIQQILTDLMLNEELNREYMSSYLFLICADVVASMIK